MAKHSLNWWSALLVFFSGYWPLGLIIALLDFDFDKLRPDHPWLCSLIMLFFVGCCIFTSWHFRFYKNGMVDAVESVENQSADLLSYSVPYIACFTMVDTGDYGQLCAMAALLFLIFYITHKTHTVLINPFLLFSGYKLFNATIIYRTGMKERCVIISKNEIEKGNIPLQKVSEGVFIDTSTPTTHESKTY